MLSLYFCRAVRVDCPASLYKEKTDYRPPAPQHQGRVPDCPYRVGSLHWHIHLSPGVAEALPDSESRRCGGARFSVPDVQKCRRRFCSARRPLPQGYPTGVLERAPHRHRNLQKSPVRQHRHDRDECGFHLEGHQ